MLIASLIIGEYALLSFQEVKTEKQRGDIDALTNAISQVIQREMIVGTSTTSMIEALLT